jgi:predicted TIM-barrel fold metal-dependent hydrolase
MSLDVTGSYRYPNPNLLWLDQRSEQILDPELPIIDPHHHIWEQEGNRYHLDDLMSDLNSGHNILATVFVQAHYGHWDSGPPELRCVGETEQIEILIAEAKRRNIPTHVCAAIVGFADLMLGENVAPVLEAHLSMSPERFRGVRHSVSRDPNFPNGIVLRPAPAGMLGDSNFRAGLKTLTKHGLTFDAMLYHRQIPELTAMAQALPDLRIVLDHFGCIIGVGPYRGREQENFALWRDDIRELSKCPNVSIKLGGLGMVICGPTYHERPEPPSSEKLAEDWRPYVETTIESFGVQRCMFESNFPVDKAMFSYSILWNAFKRLASGSTSDEKAYLFHRAAADFYGLLNVLPETQT